LIARAFFDPVAGVFPARGSVALEIVGHRLGKSLVWAIWLLMLAAAVTAPRIGVPAVRRRVLWTTIAAMALGPAVVSTLKLFTGPRCPWDLKTFGGFAEPATALLVSTGEAGRCFPAGHASGGFSLFALYFAGIALGDTRLRRIGLWAGLVAGIGFSMVRMVQGAHFLSHNLWAAAVDWTLAMMVFAVVGAPVPDAYAAPSPGDA
jgi:membrane-associated PAP2 superfamily phosphatase